MPAEPWRRVEAVFEEIAALPAGRRPEALARLCGDDRELRRQVEALLTADERAGSFLEHGAVALPPPSRLPVGHRLGAYRIERTIGEGGMSTVYLAARADREYEAHVAVKVFAWNAGHEELVRRFRAERQILASLHHPGIARLLDAGTTAHGFPYLVMEHIDGVPIDVYCRDRGLGVEARVELLLQVALAVSHAHRNLVVHRDLKPSNILVTADGVAHLLDFGIAKLLDGAVLAGGEETASVQRLLTPRFASPEQITGGAITTATDVYALGVLGYLLLADRLPYRFDAARLGALEQAIVEQEPPRPSVAARDRHPRPWLRKLAGDLDNVVARALAKEPGRRYGSVELLVEDLRRWQQGLPVSARPATTWYRLGKLVARHRLAAGLGVAVAALVVGLAIAMSVQAVRLAGQRDEIRRERDKAVETTEFLKGLFESSDPGQARGETVTARELLDAGAVRIDRQLAAQPETRAALLATVGAVYHNLGLDDRALPLLNRSLALRRKLFGDHHPEVAESLEALGYFHLSRGELQRAETAYREALAIRNRVPADPARARTLNGLGAALMLHGEHREAEALLRAALALDRVHHGRMSEQAGESVANLAQLADGQGDLAAAEALYREALGIFRRLRGGADPLTANLLNNLALVLDKRGRFEEAEAAHRESLDLARQIYGAEHLEVAMRLHNLAFSCNEQGDFRAAEQPAREALAMLRRLLGDDNPKVAMSLNNLGRTLEGRGDLPGAQAAYEQAAGICRRALGESHPQLARTLANLARLLGLRGQPREGEALARKALAIQRAALGSEHFEVGISLVVLSELRRAQGDRAEAEADLRQGYAVLRKALGDDHWRTRDARRRLGELTAPVPVRTAG